MKLHSKRMVQAEYRKVMKMLKATDGSWNRPMLYGAMQALAWALNDNAQKPSRCTIKGKN